MFACPPSGSPVEVDDKSELDQISQSYAELLEGVYDSVDRIVLNGYFTMGHSPGGFRQWWRRLHGTDDNLDDARLMRMAGRFGRRLRAYAKKHSIPVIDCKRGDRKHEIAQKHLPSDPNFKGLFLVLTGRAPAPVWHVERSKNGKIRNIERKQPYPYVKHYFFHIMDPEWGHVTIRMSGHPPFGVQIILNGHEYIACKARKKGLDFRKEGNCFTEVNDAAKLAQIAETLRSPDVVGQLQQVCDRWLYTTCLCFALKLEEQAQTDFRYQYSVYQMEYSRNFIFQRGAQMEQVVQGLIDRTRSKLDVERLKTIFGRKHRPYRHKGKGKKQPRLEVVVETPVYDMTVFKIHFDKLTVKFYTKGERVLRFEVVTHNARALKCKRSLPHFPDMSTTLRDILIRFLEHLHGIDRCFIDDDTLDTLSSSGAVGKTRTAGIDLNKPRIRAVLEAVISLSVLPNGFKVSDLAAKVRKILGFDADTYKARHASYDLKKLRGKNWVSRIGKSRRYETGPAGLQTITALLVLREKVIKPVLAGAGKPKRGPKPKDEAPVDAQYRILQREMHTLLHLLGIAA